METMQKIETSQEFNPPHHKTIAEQVSNLFDDDSIVFITEDGRYLHDVAVDSFAAELECASFDENGEIIEYHNITKIKANSRCRYVFRDGSAIVVCGNGEAWDIEGDEPFSWQCEY